MNLQDIWNRFGRLWNHKPVQNLRILLAAEGFSRWLGKGFWAVMDQGFFAVSNFILSVLLARWLVPQDYGAFSVAYIIFWLLAVFHTSLLSEPMLIFGPDKYKGRLSEYMGVLIYGHLGVSALASLLFLLAGLGFWLSGLTTLSLALSSLALAAPFILFQWLMRRACYVRLKPRLAALGSVLYMALILVGSYMLSHYNYLSTASAFGLMALASLATGSWMAVRLRLRPPSLAGSKLIREALVTHWAYGRWAAVSNALGLLSMTGSVYLLLLPIWGGLEETATLRALMNLTMPIFHTYGALSILLLPALVQVRGKALFRYNIRLFLTLFTLGAALNWVLLGLLDRSLVTWLYGGQYSEHANLLWIIGLMPLFQGVADVSGAALRALERPDLTFWAYLFSTIVTLTAGVVLLVGWGVFGAALGLLLSSMTTAGTLAWFLKRS